VVDNASTDGSVKRIKAIHPEVVLIESGVNLGFGKGSNVAASKARGKYILYLNPDTEVVTNALFGMQMFLEQNPEYGAVGCKLIYPDGTIQYTCASTFPTLRTEFNEILCLNRVFPKSKVFSTRELAYWDHRDSRTVDCLSGACMMIPADQNGRLKGFDENLFMYSEDLDLCYRILKSGYKIRYLAYESIIHYEGMSSKKRDSEHFATIMSREANYYFVRKNYGWLQSQILRLVILTGSMFRVVMIATVWPLKVVRLINMQTNLHEAIRKYVALIFWSLGCTELRNSNKTN
jgi:hypothetical protein